MAENRRNPSQKKHVSQATLLEKISITDMFNGAIQPHIVSDLQGEIIEMNPAARLYFGFEDSHTVNQSLFDCLVNEDAERLRKIISQIHEHESGLLEVQIKTENDLHLTGDLIYQLVHAGEASLLYTRFHDLQVVRHLQHDLDEKNMLFHGAEVLAKLGAWTFYPMEDRIIWSDEVFRIFGLPVANDAPSFEEYVQKVHPDDLESFLSIVQGAMAKGEGYTVKHRIVHPDGTVRWVEGRGDAFLDTDGKLVKMFGTVQDITEEEGIREAIKESQRRVRFHVDRSPLGYIEWDSQMQVVEWNIAAEEIFGFTHEEAIEGRADIIPEHSKEEVFAVVADLLNETGGTHSINDNKRKDGTIIQCEWFNTTLKKENGEIVGIGSIVQDISERLKAKEQLEDYARQLEKARDDAESAARMKSEFLANMSHEIRTPMNGVIGMASLMLDTNLDEEQRDYVETIVQSGESLLAIINDILDFSKIEAGRIELERYPFSLSTVIENTMDLLAAKAADKKLELLYWIDASVPDQVLGDPTRLQQILLNLIGNGVKFTDKGEVELRIEGERLENNKHLLTFHVIDTGIGIAEKKLNKLFKAFSQVDASTSRKYGGTGLGLSISAKLARLMGGDISVESVEGEGTTFTFSVLLEKGKREDKVSHELLKGVSVLIAESNKKVAGLLEQLVCIKGGLVRCVYSEAEIMEQLHGAQKYDVVLLDKNLDHGKGNELGAYIHGLEEPRPAVILLTPITERLSHQVYDGRLIKPISHKSLYKQLAKLAVLQE